MRLRISSWSGVIGIAGLLLSAGCGARRPMASAPTPAPELPSISQELSVPRAAPPPEIQAPAMPPGDPVEAAMQEAEAAFRRGERAYSDGHMETAKEEFDASVAALLRAPEAVRADKRVARKLDSLVDRIYVYELEALKQGDGFTEQYYDPSPMDELQALTFPDDPELGERMKEEAGRIDSDLPVAINGQVANFIKYFTSGRGRTSLETALRRSGRFRDMIRQVLAEEGVPLDLFYLAQAESAFRPMARSRAGATGLWQFMASRGKEYGLQRNWWIDERLNPEKATRAAARHLKDLYNQFGDWYLAMAAYNCGPLCVQRAVRRTAHADFWQLAARRVIPRETRNYIPIILALTIIGKNPAKYGLEDILPEEPWMYDTVTVTHPTDLRLVAEITGSSLETIRELNPALLRMTTPKVPEYSLRIPLATKDLFLKRIAMVPPEKRVWWRWHTVRYGETLSGIAKQFRTTTEAIAEVNNLDVNEPLQEAAELVIPVTRGNTAQPLGDGQRHRIRPRETLSTIARRYNVSVAQLMSWNELDSTVIRAGNTLLVGPPLDASSEEPGDGMHHRIRPRETLSTIAGRYNVTVRQLMAWNNLDSTLIQAGKTLLVRPASEEPPASRQASVPAQRRAPAASKPLSRQRAVVHRVRKGESLWEIASNYNTSVEELKRSNAHLGRILRVGDRVLIPASQ